MADSGNRVFCHACGGVWSQDHSGLTCPHCESEFTEISEHDEDPPSPPINPWADHNPWAYEGDSPPRAHNFMDSRSPRYSHHSYRSPDGRFTFSSTTIGGGFSRQGGAHPNPMIPMMLQSLESIFQNFSDPYDGAGHRAMSPHDPYRARSPGWPDQDHTGMHRHAGDEGLFPRNAEGPQPMAAPVGSLAELLETFRYSEFPTSQSRPRRHGARGVASPHPLAMLEALLNLNRNGDAVYSQEELDRVISEMIDHNAQGTAPPPASESAIRSLPRQKMTKQMMGSDGKTECSICMDAVELDTEVTVLPCTHWFHYSCIEAWLSQHNTCPHCRRSIDAVGTTNTGEGTSDNPVIIPDSPESPTSGRRRRRRSSPFSRSSRSARSSVSRSSPSSPTPETSESHIRRGSRGESHRGGLTGWVWSRFGGGSG